MSANIPEYFKVDFTQYSKDMTAEAMQRILSQFDGSEVLKQFLGVFIKEGPQYVYDEIIKFQEANSLYMAKGVNLDAIGRIVGQPRVPYALDDTKWFFTDRAGQGIDQAPAWCSPAPLTSTKPANDGDYQMMILARIACNFCRFSSLPELQYLAEFVTGEKVTWRRVGPMEAEIIVRYGISLSKLHMLTKFTTTTFADGIPMIPYPATLNLTSAMYMLGDRVFRTDRGDGWQIDAAPITMSVPV